MVALALVESQAEVRSEDHNSIVRLLKGQSGTEQAVLLTRLNDAVNPSLTVKNLNASGHSFKALDASGNQLVSINQYGLAVGPTSIVGSGNFFAVTRTASLTAGQLATIEMDNIGGSAGDVSGLRVVMREKTAADNQSHAAEIHALWTSGTGAYQRSAITVSAQANLASASGVEHNILRILTVPTAWAMASPDPIDNALSINYGGEAYLTNFISGYSSSTTLTFRVSAAGTITSGHHYPLADSTYDLGTGTGPFLWRTIYAYGHVVGNGSAANPSVALLNSLTTGLFRVGADDLGITTAGTRRMNVDANGNVVIGTGAVATNAANGMLRIPMCAGTPTGTPTAMTGLGALMIDSTNHKLYFYDASWVAVN